MFKFTAMLIFIYSCTSPQIQNKVTEPGETIDLILQLGANATEPNAKKIFGNPKTIKRNGSALVYGYSTDNHSQENLHLYLSKDGKNVANANLFYWMPFDNYVHLKKKFGNHQWKESPIKQSSKTDLIENKIHVSILDLGINFEYDEQDPLRKIMLIYFDLSRSKD